jgi:hypothetical protein
MSGVLYVGIISLALASHRFPHLSSSPHRELALLASAVQRDVNEYIEKLDSFLEAFLAQLSAVPEVRLGVLVHRAVSGN